MTPVSADRHGGDHGDRDVGPRLERRRDRGRVQPRRAAAGTDAERGDDGVLALERVAEAVRFGAEQVQVSHTGASCKSSVACRAIARTVHPRANSNAYVIAVALARVI